MTPPEQIATDVVDAAFQVHSTLGPGLLENAYEACMVHELTCRGYKIEQQRVQPVIYRGLQIEAGYRLDLLVNDQVILELKAIDQLLPIHQAQLMTYLRLSGKTLGFLINFNVPVIKVGIKRVVMNHSNF